MHQEICRDYPSKLGEIRGMDIRLETVELFKSRKLRVFDRASSENSFIEGECWWPDSNGIANITELGDLTERRIEVVEYSKDAFEVYDVHYTSLAALQIDNPAFTKRGPVTHTCEKCRSIISIRNPLYTQYCTCPSCGALCRYRKTIGLVHKPKEIKKLEPYIPPGSRGKINGIEYEVMGPFKNTKPVLSAQTGSNTPCSTKKRDSLFFRSTTAISAISRNSNRAARIPIKIMNWNTTGKAMHSLTITVSILFRRPGSFIPTSTGSIPTRGNSSRRRRC